mmetsp:Transcript_30823/g.106567  ORF Transcript_30823/g.106567 Transcript_30823/m.106567 type:complete len:232 (-) Transcript_30823:88-783(-)
MCSDDEEGAGGANVRIVRPRTPRTALGKFAAAAPSTRSAATAPPAAAKQPRGAKAAPAPAAKRSRVEPPPAATAANASPRVVHSLEDLVDPRTQRGNRYAPLHRTEQITIVIKLATAELDAVIANGAAAAAARAAAAAPPSAGGGGGAPRLALSDVGAQRLRRGSVGLRAVRILRFASLEPDASAAPPGFRTYNYPSAPLAVNPDALAEYVHSARRIVLNFPAAIYPRRRP